MLSDMATMIAGKPAVKAYIENGLIVWVYRTKTVSWAKRLVNLPHDIK